MNQKLLNRLMELSFDLINMPVGQNKHFTYLLVRNKILSVGWNNYYKTDPLAAKMGSKFPTVHSELAAIKNFPLAPGALNRCIVVNTRVNSHGRILMSKPCSRCEKMLRFFEVKRVYYTTNYGVLEL